MAQRKSGLRRADEEPEAALADASHLAEADSALRYGLDIGLDRDTAALFG